MNNLIYKYVRTFFTSFLVILIFSADNYCQELETALIKLGRIWTGVTANGAKGSFEFRAGFFPNDYGIIAIRGHNADAFAGAGIMLAATNWKNPYLADSIMPAAVYGYTNDFMPTGKVVSPLSNFVRYRYPVQKISHKDVQLDDFGIYDPQNPEFANHSFDQVIKVTNQTIFNVAVQRKIMMWSQNFNDDYIIADLLFTNQSSDTLYNFYIRMHETGGNSYFSTGNNPSPPSSENYDPRITWLHYYGGRPGDSLRVFYEYSADDPKTPGDNMGSPITSQKGRLLNPNFTYQAFLHASEEPFDDFINDKDDPFQPKVTYIGKSNKIPYAQQDDEYGSANYHAIRGGYSDLYPMPGRIEGTHHGINNDELGITDYSGYVAGEYRGIQDRISCFGPYTFAPGKKIRIVYASGFTGIGYKKGQEIGEKWLMKTLEDPPNMPDPNTGWLPSNFAFPLDATEMDKRKDRWVSMGIDSVMLSASRAKWNFEHNYNIPQAPPPPSSVTITGLGKGVEIKWSAPEAEALANFSGYRIMRKLSNADTLFYEPIYDSGSEDKSAEHIFIDETYLFGAQYYYYVQTKAKIDENDLNAYPLDRGKIMFSSRVLCPDIYFVKPPRPSQDDLSKIRIVPNPYNINDPLLVSGLGVTDQRQISFVNLPVICKIKIFTENGDLIKSIDHYNPEEESGSEDWDMITSSQQVISSGLYIAVFEKPGGELSYQKFIVVR